MHGNRPGPPSAARSAARVNRMLAVVAARFATPTLSMQDVAGSIGLCARSGYLLFAAAGLDFGEQLRGIRLDHARDLLVAGGPSGPRVLDVALAVGFADLSGFNRRFRERFGCTPTQVRRGVGRAPSTPTTD